MKKTTKTLIILGVIVVVLVILSSAMFVEVPTGHTGVVLTFGRVENYVLAEGLNFKLPWQTVVKMDNRTQKSQLELSAFSSDIQQVDVACSVNYSVDRETSQTLYQTVGQYYYSTVVEPRIFENLKAVFSKYTADSLVANRNVISTEIEELLAPEIKAYGIELVSVSIENIDFTDVFTEAVEAKQVAEQSKLQAEIEEAQKLMVTKNEAERKKISAEAEAEVQKIEAEADAYAVSVAAEAEAEANKKIAESLTSGLIDYKKIEQWSGELPGVYSGDGMSPIIDMRTGTQSASGQNGAAALD